MIHWIHMLIPLAAATVLPAATTPEIAARVKLLTECEITAPSVTLADLLAPGAPTEIHQAAAQVSLGAAPLPGAVRVFTSNLILNRISEKDLQRLIEIPDRIVVRRASRPLASAEVFETVQRVLTANHFALATTITLGDLRMTAPVLVATGPVSLRITRIEFDSGLGRLRLLIVPESGQGSLPFIATLTLREEPASGTFEKFDAAASSTEQPAPKNIEAASDSTEQQMERLRNTYRAPPPLVAPGRPALLRILSSDMRIVLTVLPLENGALGQEIRVRVPETGKIVRARVAGDGYLETSL